MFESIWSDIKWRFNQGSTLTRIIILNVTVFVLVNIVRFILVPIDGVAPPPSYEPFIHFFCMPADWKFLLTHPWVPFTSMFLHDGFWHLFWNMLLLYWFGIIVSDLLGAKRIMPIYLLGGLACAMLYFIMANISSPWAMGSYAMGASGAVMATLLVAGVTAPNYVIHLLFLGPVRLKYIVFVLVFLDLIALSWNNNSGGSFGHIGGAIMGYVIAAQLKQGRDLTQPVNDALDWIMSIFGKFRFRPKGPRMAYKNPRAGHVKSNSSGRHKQDEDYQTQLDNILDKIKKSSYESLSQEEKEFLFKASKK